MICVSTALKGYAVKSISIDQMLAEIGEGMREQRLQLNLSQQTEAERSAVSIKAMKNLESGAGVSLRSFLAICRTLGKTDWLGTIPPPSGESPIEMWKLLNKPKRQRAAARKVETHGV